MLTLLGKIRNSRAEMTGKTETKIVSVFSVVSWYSPWFSSGTTTRDRFLREGDSKDFNVNRKYQEPDLDHCCHWESDLSEVWNTSPSFCWRRTWYSVLLSTVRVWDHNRILNNNTRPDDRQTDIEIKPSNLIRETCAGFLYRIYQILPS